MAANRRNILRTGFHSLPVVGLAAVFIGAALALNIYEGGWLVSVYGLGFDSTVYLRNTVDFITAGDIFAGLIKAVLFGGIIAIMGCYQGDRSQAGATGVGRAATLSMVGAAVLVLAFNYVLSTLFVEIGL